MHRVIFVNKEKGMTSFDVCNKVRRILNVKKVGHTGTLDPNATGLMVLTIDSTAKFLPFLVCHNKEYIAEMKLGFKTDTLDLDGQIIETRQIDSHDEKQVRDALNSFLGEQKQTPPMYSAKKINGQKLVDLARKGIQVERKPQDITINDIELLEFNHDLIKFRVNCSKGTYIRVLCQDIGLKLNELATMTSLVRTKIDKFSIDESYYLSDIENNNFKYHDITDLLDNYQIIEYRNIQDVYNGKTIQLDNCDDLVFIKDKDDIIAVYQKENDNKYHCLRGLW